MTRIDEIAPDLFRLCTFIKEYNLQFNQFLVRDEEPLLWHAGLRGLLPEVREAVARLLDPTTLRWVEFYKHESCGKCTPCREGTWWLVQALTKLQKGQGTEADLEVVLDQCDTILGRSFCALADGAVSPIASSINLFREEYLAHLSQGGCPFDPAASTLFATAGAQA